MKDCIKGLLPAASWCTWPSLHTWCLHQSPYISSGTEGCPPMEDHCDYMIERADHMIERVDYMINGATWIFKNDQLGVTWNHIYRSLAQTPMTNNDVKVTYSCKRCQVELVSKVNLRKRVEYALGIHDYTKTLCTNQRENKYWSQTIKVLAEIITSGPHMHVPTIAIYC